MERRKFISFLAALPLVRPLLVKDEFERLPLEVAVKTLPPPQCILVTHQPLTDAQLRKLQKAWTEGYFNKAARPS